MRTLGKLLPAIACGALLIGCADGSSSAARAAGAIPAGGAQSVVGAPRAAVRKTANVPTCSAVGSDSFIGGADFNVAAGTAAGVLAGHGNEACDAYSSIGGGNANAISSGDVSIYSFIGAGYSNTITGSAEYGFLGAGHSNTLTGLTAVLSGGFQNQNAGTNAMLGAGETNSISSAAKDSLIGGGSTNTVSAEYGTIAGGVDNGVSGEGGYVGAGGYNSVSGEGAVADGGFSNTAAGAFATIPGGYANAAAGTYSFAAGARASAGQTGTFVWSDGSNGDTTLASTVTYQFIARASGGFELWTNAGATVGATLAPGSGTWASASDRNLKTDVARIDDDAVLEKVASLPISRWSYKSERGVRHVGPMAQDFYAAFGVGEDDKHITSIDEDGVALAAIKALHAENASLRALGTSQAAQIANLRASQARHDLLVQRQLQRLNAAVAALRERKQVN